MSVHLTGGGDARYSSLLLTYMPTPHTHIRSRDHIENLEDEGAHGAWSGWNLHGSTSGRD